MIINNFKKVKMKITAFIGSGRKQHTYRAAEFFLQKLQAQGDVDYEIVRLSDYSIQPCRGCRQCLDKGSEFCPLKDDRDLLIEKINCSDGVVFATPNYAFQVSGMMKNFIDRMAFILHRPRYFGKTFTCIVAQGISQGEKITEYLDFIGRGLGFNIIKGCCIKTLEPLTEAGRAKIEKTIDSHSRKFYQVLTGSKNPVPSMFWLMAFRMARTSVKKMLDEKWRDYTYYRDNGWFESDYFYPVKLNPAKKLAGKLVDRFALKIIRM